MWAEPAFSPLVADPVAWVVPVEWRSVVMGARGASRASVLGVSRFIRPASTGDVAMRAVVVYESMFGNTHTIANAIGKGIGQDLEAVDNVIVVSPG